MIAFIADTHDDTLVIDEMRRVFDRRGVETVVHLGDVTLSSTARRFRSWELHAVFGNADVAAGKEQLRDAVNDLGTHHGWEAKLTFGGSRFFCRHGLDRTPSYVMAAKTTFDYVMHGHYHTQECTQVSSGWVMNPGTGVYLYDEADDSFEYVSVQVGVEA